MRKLFGLFLFFILSVQFFATDEIARNELWAQANDFFAQAGAQTDVAIANDLYAQAARRYQKIIDEYGGNEKLYYNLGNSYFLLGELGNAILSYRRAENYAPHDLNLQRNLSLARARCQNYLPPTEKATRGLLFFHYDLSLNLRRLIAVIAFGLFWLLLLVRRFYQKLSRHYLVLTAIMAGVFFSSLLYQAWEAYQNPAGVIIAQEVNAKQGDGNNYAPAFQQPLFSGMEFRLREKREQWWHIILPDERECWIPANAAQLVQ